MRTAAVMLGLAMAAGAQDAKPVVVDLSKYKGPTESAELFGYDEGNSKAFWYAAGILEFKAKVEADGDYQVVVKASCDEAMKQFAKFKLHVDGKPVGEETALKAADEKEYVLTAPLKAGDVKLGLEFTNDLYKEGEYDLNFYVHGLTLKPAAK